MATGPAWRITGSDDVQPPPSPGARSHRGCASGRHSAQGSICAASIMLNDILQPALMGARRRRMPLVRPQARSRTPKISAYLPMTTPALAVSQRPIAQGAAARTTGSLALPTVALDINCVNVHGGLHCCARSGRSPNWPRLPHGGVELPWPAGRPKAQLEFKISGFARELSAARATGRASAKPSVLGIRLRHDPDAFVRSPARVSRLT